MKIGTKLMVIITVVNLVSIGALTVGSMVFTSGQVKKLVNHSSDYLTEVTANKVKLYMEVPLDEVRALAVLLSKLERALPPPERRSMVNFMLRSILEHNPSYMGSWAIFERNTLDGMDDFYANTPETDHTGRFISYFTQVNGKIDFYVLKSYNDPGPSGDFYFTSFKSGKEAIVEPYIYAIDGTPYMLTSVTVPIIRDGRILGVVGVDLEMSKIQSMVEGINPFGNGVSMVFSNTGQILAHPDLSHIGKKMAETEAEMLGGQLKNVVDSIKNGVGYNGTFYSPEAKANVIVDVQPFSVGGNINPWAVASIIPEKTVMASVYQMTTLFVVFGVVILAVITIVIFLVARSITVPLKSMERIFNYVGEGDFTHTIEIRSNDEIGNISRSLNTTMEKIRNLIMTIKTQATSLHNIGSRLTDNMNHTASVINEITANVMNIKNRVINQSTSVTQTNAAMEQITVNINKLNNNIAQQTNSVSKSSSAIEQMLMNIQSVTNTLMNNAKNVNELTESSEIGRTGLQEVAADIQEISRESEGLIEINSVMDNIASQTNLLSMNAAIEAAHAGEAGKGFAVVADEIRKLAENSSEQSKTISTVLKKIKESIDKISHSTNTVLKKFEAIDSSVRTVADQEESIRNAMEEQGEGSKQILEALSQLNDITQQVKNGSIEMNEGSKEVIQEGKNLEQLTLDITGGINDMASGTDQINSAVTQVSEISDENKENIDILFEGVALFKVE